MKKRPAPRALTASVWLLIAAVFLPWLASMAALTVVTAQELLDRLYSESMDFTDTAARSGRFHEYYDESFWLCGKQYEKPDYWEYNMLSSIRNSGIICRPGSGPSGKTLLRDIQCPVETAVLFYDGEGRLLHSSEEDILFFDYFTQAEWEAGLDTGIGPHYGWIDISEGKNADNWQDDPYLRFRTLYAGDRTLHDLAVLRVTGYFEGTQLIPVTMHYMTGTLAYQAAASAEELVTPISETESKVNIESFSQLDRAGLLDWQLQFDRSAGYDGARELVTVYAERPAMWDYAGSALRYQGAEYEGLAALTREQDFPAWGEPYQSLDGQGVCKLSELLVFARRTWYDERGADPENGVYPVPELTMVTAARCNPLRFAVAALRNLYLATGLLALLLVLIVRGQLKARLLDPVREVAGAMEKDWTNLRRRPDGAPDMWREAADLTAAYDGEKDRRRWKDNELARLNTALDYAKTAEERRRRLTSNVAHELKTPLAVIHSYAEGLKEHIAEDKQEHYIDVILSESERADGFVLELLDLSRLEAGRVKLSRDEFSLIALTRAVFEKLEKPAQAKALRMDFDFPEDFTIVADEGRIAQVVENLAANAVKYTSAGGHVAVRIRQNRSGAVFSIENDSAPLSADALAHVWDSFYRADEARSEEGTGLGLAIVKSIVELHGGKCAVRNTKTGVEFRFEL